MERRFTGQMSYAGPTGCCRSAAPQHLHHEDGMAQHYAFSFTADPTAVEFTLQAVPAGWPGNSRDGQCGTLDD